MSFDKLLTLPEFAKIVRAGESTVYSWMKRGILTEGVHFARFGGLVRFAFPIPPLQTRAGRAAKPDRPKRAGRRRSTVAPDLGWRP